MPKIYGDEDSSDSEGLEMADGNQGGKEDHWRRGVAPAEAKPCKKPAAGGHSSETGGGGQSQYKWWWQSQHKWWRRRRVWK